jgi:RNA polymerase sigma-70 factor (ECF subfamily)
VDRPESDDQAIRTLLTANEPSALEMIWNRYASDLLGYLTSMLCSRHDAEDALQDVFLSIVKKRQSVAQARLLKPYLFRMARNEAFNRIKHGQRMQKHADEAAWLVLHGEPDAHDDRESRMTTALETLPEEQRTVIVMKHYRGQTFREIGESLGISENTAGSRYRYGMEKLRALVLETQT